MLEEQKKLGHRTFFTCGLEAARMRMWHIELLKKLRPKEIFFGCDDDEKFYHLGEAVKLFKEADYFSHNTLRAYVLAGYRGDTFEDAERRLRRVKDLGVCPMAMLYRDMSGAIIQPEKDWTFTKIMGSSGADLWEAVLNIRFVTPERAGRYMVVDHADCLEP
ncbi:MAG: hypothetical protein LBG12_09035 [Synergistaceae bacterium]|jgi:hypothetical protein|nr:hypothetical protein [Synergistaceae bacterium]